MKENNSLLNVNEFDDANAMLDVLRNPEKVAYSSMMATTDEEKVALFNAMTNPDKRVSEMVNTVIELKDVYAEIVDITNRETGEVIKAPRIVLIDKSGVSYSCVSTGILNALKSVFAVFGTPDTWSGPKKVKVSSIEKSDRRILTLKMVK